MSKVSRYLITILFGSIATTSYAAIFKCVDSNGRINYSDRPCKMEDVAAQKIQVGTPLTEKAINTMLEKVEVALKSKNIEDYKLNFSPNAKFTLDMPSNMGGKLEMDLVQYLGMMKKGWSMQITSTYEITDVNISIDADKTSAVVTSTVNETAQLNGTTISTVTKERLTVQSINGTPMITSLYGNLTFQNM